MPTTAALALPYPVLTDTPDVPRDVLALANRIEAIFAGASTAFSPAWSAASSAPTLGNGSLTARYWKIDKHIYYTMRLVFGSTTDGGRGDWSFTLPFAPAVAGHISCMMFANGFNFFGSMILVASSTSAKLMSPANPGAVNAGTVRNADASGVAGTGIPTITSAYSFVNTNTLDVQGFYETT